MANKATMDRLVRNPECTKITGIGKTTRWKLEKRGEFPRRVRISDRAVGWRFSELQAWVKSKKLVRADCRPAVPKKPAGG